MMKMITLDIPMMKIFVLNIIGISNIPMMKMITLETIDVKTLRRVIRCSLEERIY